jgi:transcriptional regulator with XRE-family HTH domain
MTDRKRGQPAPAEATDEAYATMGSRLREAREFLGLSQEVVAEVLQIPRASVSAIESGRRKVSSLELRDLARLYKRPLEYFYDDAERADDEDDETAQALFRATRNLTEDDKAQVLRFAEFLRGSGRAPERRRAR